MPDSPKKFPSERSKDWSYKKHGLASRFLAKVCLIFRIFSKFFQQCSALQSWYKYKYNFFYKSNMVIGIENSLQIGQHPSPSFDIILALNCNSPNTKPVVLVLFNWGYLQWGKKQSLTLFAVKKKKVWFPYTGFANKLDQ